MQIVFDIESRFVPRFTRGECCTSLYDRGGFYVASSFEKIVSRGVRKPRHISVGRFRAKDVARSIPDRSTPCLLPWTFIECECGDIFENLTATKTTLEVLQYAGFNLLHCHIVFSGNKSFWIAIPSYLMGNPIGTVEDQKALRQRVFLPLMEYPVDEGLWDGRHLHRMIGSMHERGGSVRAVAFRDMFRMLFVDAPAARPVSPYLGAPCPILYARAIEKSRFHVPAFREVPRIVEASRLMDTTDEGVSEGNRNEIAFKRACYLIRRMNEQDAMRELAIWNSANDPPLPERELKMCLRSAKRTADRDKKRAA